MWSSALRATPESYAHPQKRPSSDEHDPFLPPCATAALSITSTASGRMRGLLRCVDESLSSTSDAPSRRAVVTTRTVAASPSARSTEPTSLALARSMRALFQQSCRAVRETLVQRIDTNRGSYPQIRNAGLGHECRRTNRSGRRGNTWRNDAHPIISSARWRALNPLAEAIRSERSAGPGAISSFRSRLPACRGGSRHSNDNVTQRPECDASPYARLVPQDASVTNAYVFINSRTEPTCRYPPPTPSASAPTSVCTVSHKL